MRKILPLLASLALGACAYPAHPPALASVTQPAPPPAANEQRAPVTILVSIDGFRPDYLNRGVTPHLSALARTGVSASMRPSFPSKTFPNHWTLVTGMVPDRHGIVANGFTDPARPTEPFTMASDDPFWWNAAEPIWVTAEKAGIRTATMFWPGSNVAWGGTAAQAWPHRITGGTRPTDWQQFNQQVNDRQRVDAVIDWLRRPAETRPRLLTLYFDEVDTAGHQNGPDAAETTQAIAAVDRAIGELVEGLARLNQPANLVIVADHGMAATSSTRTIALDTLLDPADYVLNDSGPYATFTPAPGHEAALAARLLARHPHMQCWRKEAMPARFRYGRNRRIPPFLCLAETGWTISAKAPDRPTSGGTHGYDPADPTMAALFIAHGPAFIPGRRLAPFDNPAVAPLLRDLIGLPPGQGLDGTDAPFQKVLRR